MCPCRHCGKRVHESASDCPFCGAVAPASESFDEEENARNDRFLCSPLFRLASYFGLLGPYFASIGIMGGQFVLSEYERQGLFSSIVGGLVLSLASYYVALVIGGVAMAVSGGLYAVIATRVSPGKNLNIFARLPIGAALGGITAIASHALLGSWILSDIDMLKAGLVAGSCSALFVRGRIYTWAFQTERHQQPGHLKP